MREGRHSLRDLESLVQTSGAKSKDRMRHIKLSRFSGETTPKGSHRHNAGHVAVTGIEADYDAGDMPLDKAVHALAQAGVAALVYTTPSHLQDGKGHRWRVLCPLSDEASPAERERLVARLNGALGGVLSGESFTASQSYAFGTVQGLEDAMEARLVDGRFLDACDDLDPAAIGKPRPERGDPVEPADLSEDTWRVEKAAGMLEAAAERLSETLVERNDALCREAFLAGGLLGNSLVTRDQVIDAFLPAMTANGYLDDHARGDVGEVERVIDAQLEAGRREPFDPGGEPVFDDLDEPEIDDLLDTSPEKATKVGPLTLLSPEDCAASNARPYVVKGLIAERDLGCIVGAPGVGKSVLAPALAYAVAQGRDAHGRRVKAGAVFYVAAEDEHGMRGRVTALKSEHGDAQDFTLVCGVTDLLSEDVAGKGSRHFQALRRAVKERRPSLIVIDTLAMSFPGLEENSAEGMGRVVAVTRALTQWGAAVLLVHHDSKDGHQGLPRGHSLLNGALDLSIHLTKGQDGTVRGRLTKNRNGPCDVDLAFQIRGVPIGEDEDGDVVTAVLCEEVDAIARSTEPRLAPGEAAALNLAIELIGDADSIDRDDWLDAAASPDELRITTAANSENRRRAARRILGQLVAKNQVALSDGRIRLAEIGIDQEFDDLPHEVEQ
ncbi:MAG: AAA family ATPase [Pseudomonadota bacterium]